jgi:hypothetical protein
MPAGTATKMFIRTTAALAIATVFASGWAVLPADAASHRAHHGRGFAAASRHVWRPGPHYYYYSQQPLSSSNDPGNTNGF